LNPLSIITLALIMSPVMLGGELFSNEASIPSADDVADSILDRMIERVLSFLNSIASWTINTLQDINDYVDDTIVSKYILGESGQTADELKESPLWMTWALIKGVIFVLFWMFVIRLIISGLDIWKYILDIVPFV